MNTHVASRWGVLPRRPHSSEVTRPRKAIHLAFLALIPALIAAPRLEAAGVASPILLKAASRKTHGQGGATWPYDVALSLDGDATIEPRLGGADRIVFTFDGPVNLTCADLSLRHATCVTTLDLNAGMQWEVQLDNVALKQRETIILSSDLDLHVASPHRVDVLSLPGDVDASGSVTVMDLARVKAGMLSPEPLSDANCHRDVDHSGQVTVSDLSAVKARQGASATVQLEAAAETDRSILLSWTRGSRAFAGYTVDRFTPDGHWQLLATTGPNAWQYHDTAAADHPAACYRVTGQNGPTDSEQSPTVCAANPAVLTLLQPPTTLHVTSEAELAAAAAQSATGDVEILIYGQVPIEGHYTFSAAYYSVQMRGATPDAGIVFTRRWDGDWNSPEAVSQNGLTFRGAFASVEDMTFSGYEWKGSAVKAHTSYAFVVRRCVFAEIGTLVYPPRSEPVLTSDQVWFANAIGGGAYSGWLADVWIDACTFRRCALNSFYGHPIYVWGDTATATNCLFDGTGSANAFSSESNGHVVNGGVNVLANLFTRGRQVPGRSGALGSQPLMRFPFGPAVFAFNTIVGHNYNIAHNNFQSPELQHVDYNDYADMTYSLTWATQATSWITLDQWTTTLGQDLHSRLPE